MLKLNVLFFSLLLISLLEFPAQAEAKKHQIEYQNNNVDPWDWMLLKQDGDFLSSSYAYSSYFSSLEDVIEFLKGKGLTYFAYVDPRDYDENDVDEEIKALGVGYARFYRPDQVGERPLRFIYFKKGINFYRQVPALPAGYHWHWNPSYQKYLEEYTGTKSDKIFYHQSHHDSSDRALEEAFAIASSDPEITHFILIKGRFIFNIEGVSMWFEPGDVLYFSGSLPLWIEDHLLPYREIPIYFKAPYDR